MKESLSDHVIPLRIYGQKGSLECVFKKLIDSTHTYTRGIAVSHR